MSQSTIVKRKSSPCCIGCIVLLVIAIGVAAAMSIWGYRFFKENIGFHNVVNVADPAPDAQPETLFPESVGEFTRIALNEEAPQIPGMENMETSGMVTARYEDAEQHLLHAVAVPTEQALQQRQQQTGPLTVGRASANAPNMGVSVKNPMDGGSTTLTWTKPNWTFMLYTTSTVAGKFVESYRPTGSPDQAPEIESDDTVEATPVDTAPVQEPEPASTQLPATGATPSDSDAESTETL